MTKVIRGLIGCLCMGMINVSCSSQNISKIAADTIVRDIPKPYQSEHYQQITHAWEQQLDLPVIENGYNGLQIRIWNGIGYNGKLIILTTEDSIWHSKLYEFSYGRNGHDDSISITKFSSVQDIQKPLSESFINAIFKLGIMDLPDWHMLPDYDPSMGGGAITFQIADKKHYRIYGYADVKENSEKFFQAKNVVEIKKLIEKELKIELY